METIRSITNALKNNKLPLFFVFTGIVFPPCVYKYVIFKADRMHLGIEKDMNRLKDNGKRLSDIPQSFHSKHDDYRT